MPDMWKSLEAIPRLLALPVVWRRWLGDDFELFRDAFLQSWPTPAKSYPCPRDCGCWHKIVPNRLSSIDYRLSSDPPQQSPAPSEGTSSPSSPPDRLSSIGYRLSSDPPGPPLPSDGRGVRGEGKGEGYTASCQCDPPTCPDLTLTLADITIWELNWTNLARALRKAFGLDAKLAAHGLPGTGQIGSWSADAVPVILTIQSDPREFRATVAELVARLRQKFILFAPTSRHLDATCQELLANAGAAFFSIDTTVTLTPHGTLHPTKTPGDLFAAFTPQPKEIDQSVAERAFALVQQLDSDGPKKPPSVLTVFRLYCIEELSAEQIAHKLHVSKATVVRRLHLIRKKTGQDPAQLRRVSHHIARIEDQTSDPRAKRIRRGDLADGDSENDPA